MPTRPRTYPTRPGLLVVPLLLAALGACSDSDPTASGSTALGTSGGGIASEAPAQGTAPDVHGDLAPPLEPGRAGSLTAADGYLPEGATLSPFADVPAIENLRPDVRAAVQGAARAAAEDGVVLRITSGWRSAAYQQALFDAAVAEYGSVEAASAYVLRPDESEHVTGRAVDIGPTDATGWMQQHGADFGLCQTYGNEPWHYEPATTPGTACPPPLTDARAG